MQPMRHFAEERKLLLEVNIDAAEENRDATALVFLLQGHGEIERDHEDLVTLPAEFGDEGVIAETIAAIHASRAWCHLNDPHAPCPCRKTVSFPARPLARIGRGGGGRREMTNGRGMTNDKIQMTKE